MIRLNRPSPGDALDVSLVEADLATVEAATGALDSENYALEGFDQHAYSEGTLSQVSDFYASDGVNAAFTQSAMALVQIPSGTSFRVNNVIIPTNAQARVMASLDCYGQSIPAGDRVEFEIAYNTTAGGTVELGDTLVWKGDDAEPTNFSPRLVAVLPAGTYNWIAVWGRVVGGGTVTLQAASMTVEMFGATA